MNQVQPFVLSEVIRIFPAIPGLQLVFRALAAVTWLASANIVVAYHYKHVRIAFFEDMFPFEPI